MNRLGNNCSAREKNRIDFFSPARCRSAVLQSEVLLNLLFCASVGTNRGVRPVRAPQGGTSNRVEPQFPPIGRFKKWGL